MRVDIYAILLAAGQARRMGGNKALLPFGDTTLLEYQVTTLTSLPALTRLIVVLGFEAERLLPLLIGQPRVEIVENPDYTTGRVSSIKAGLAVLFREERGGVAPSLLNHPPLLFKERGTKGERSAIFIIGVDQPRPLWVLERLVKEHLGGSQLITLPSYRGNRGHPPLFPAALLPELMAISEVAQGLREVMARYRAQTRVVEMDTPAVLLDINTPEDYEETLKLPW